MDCSMPGFPVHHQLLNLLKLMSIELVMPSNHLVLCHPLLLPPSIFPSIRVFSKESVLCIRWPKYWSFSFSISPSNEYSELIPLWLTGLISLQSKDSQESSPTSQFKSMVQLSHPDMTATSLHFTLLYWKTMALTRQAFVDKVMSLLFNMLSRFVTDFLSRTKCLLTSWLQSTSAVILEPRKIVWHCFHCFPIYLP